MNIFTNLFKKKKKIKKDKKDIQEYTVSKDRYLTKYQEQQIFE